MTELKAKWKSPVDLKAFALDENGKKKQLVNLLSHELKALGDGKNKGVRFVIFRGPAGVGKTYSPTVWAAENGWDLFIQECSGDMGYFDLIGAPMFDGAGGAVFQAGVIASAVWNAQNGRPTLLVLDEINMLPQNVLKEINSVFDFREAVETPIGRICGSGNLKIVGTCNSEAESCGFELDVSLQSRAVIMTLEAKEMARRMESEKVVDKVIKRLIADTGAVFSLREAHQVLDLSPIYGAEEAMRIVVNKYTNLEKRKMVLQAVGNVYGEEFGSKMSK